ncbi:MAG TPA: cytochrome c [Noviherbaspirillum sp.]|nr:cytochrome c [Noviherbaspirillum sp.]
MKAAASLRHLLGACMLALAGTQACAQDANAGLIKRGEYLAIAGDCIACHTAPGGRTMAGGLSLSTPVGSIVSTNITPSKTHGIGNYTLAQFTAALRTGIRADGAHLYPAMPYTAYALVSDDDIRALYAYFMQAVSPVDAPPPRKTELPFPFNLRLSMAAWNALFLNNKPFQSDPGKSAEWNRGAYLVRGLAHCSACHSPRNLLMAEQSSRELAGGEIGPWFAPNITSDAISGIGGWNVQELADYLRQGHATGKAQAAGPMVEAIDHSLRHLTEADVRAMAVYLKTVPAQRNDTDTRPAYAWGSPADDLPVIRGVALPQDRNRMSGAQLYDANCATCHQAHGQGSSDGGLPPLFHSTGVGRLNTNNLVMVILEGIQRNAGASDTRMPGFAHDLSDQQIATLAGYLTQRYGNPAARVTVEQVKNLRAGGSSSKLVTLARAGLAVVVIIVFASLAALFQRRRRYRR